MPTSHVQLDTPFAGRILSKSWDDATFQSWAKNTFEPVPKFSYGEIELAPAQTVGVFTIERVSEYPHVVRSNLGGVLFEGQVWFRRGTQNVVAQREDLQGMFLGPEPFKIGNLSDPELTKITAYYKHEGREIGLVRFSEKDSRLARGFDLGRYPGSRREVWVGEYNGRYENILMLKPTLK